MNVRDLDWKLQVPQILVEMTTPFNQIPSVIL